MIFIFQDEISFVYKKSNLWISAWKAYRSLRAKSQKIPGGHHESFGKIHGRHCMRFGKNCQGLHSVHEGAENRAGDFLASGLCRSQACQWKAQVCKALMQFLIVQNSVQDLSHPLPYNKVGNARRNIRESDLNIIKWTDRSFLFEFRQRY